MNKLSDRLQMIADNIKPGETMADIGTDHGFLPLYLIEQGISPRVIMTDISEPSLRKGIDGAEILGKNVPEIDIYERCDFRSGDGLTIIRAHEVDNVVIAGMGGLLMTEILGEDISKTLSFKRLILQPRNHSEQLRKWLASNGFNIVREQLVREGKFICEIITAQPGRCVLPDRPGESELPKVLLEDYRDLAVEFAGIKVAIEEKILEGMSRGKESDPAEIQLIQKRIEYFREIANG